MRKATFALAAAATMAAAGVSTVPTVTAPVARVTGPQLADQPATQTVAPATEQSALSQSWKQWRHTTRRYPAPGWSVMHDRRLARKRRNRAANRQAQRG